MAARPGRGTVIAVCTLVLLAGLVLGVERSADGSYEFYGLELGGGSTADAGSGPASEGGAADLSDLPPAPYAAKAPADGTDDADSDTDDADTDTDDGDDTAGDADGTTSGEDDGDTGASDPASGDTEDTADTGDTEDGGAADEDATDGADEDAPSGEEDFALIVRWWDDSVDVPVRLPVISVEGAGTFEPDARVDEGLVGPVPYARELMLRVELDEGGDEVLEVPFTVTTDMDEYPARNVIHVEAGDERVRVLGNPVNDFERTYER